MSWSASGTTLEKVRESFDRNYPTPAVGVKEQFEIALEAVEALSESVTNNGDSCSANVNKTEGVTRFNLNGHVATVGTT